MVVLSHSHHRVGSIPILTSHGPASRPETTHETQRGVQRLFMLACAHSDFHASNSGVFVVTAWSIRQLCLTRYRLPIQRLVIAVGIPRIAHCLPWLRSAKSDAGTSSLKTTWELRSRFEMTKPPDSSTVEIKALAEITTLPHDME